MAFLIDEKRFTSPTSSTQVNAVIGPTAGMVISRCTRSANSESRWSDRSRADSVFCRRTRVSRYSRSSGLSPSLTARRQASLAWHDDEDSFSVNGNEDVFVHRVYGNRVDATTLERDLANKRFGSCIDNPNSSAGGRRYFRRSLR